MSAPATDPRLALYASSRRLIAISIPGFESIAILAIRRIRSIDLAHEGFAEVIGATTAQVMREAAEQEKELLIRLATSNPESHASIKAQAAEARTRATDALYADLGSDPQRLRALYQRFEAWISASVESIGWAAEGISEGLLSAGMSPETACIDLGGNRRLLPLRFVQGEGRPAEGEFSIKDLPDATLIRLGVWVVAAFSEAAEVRPF